MHLSRYTVHGGSLLCYEQASFRDVDSGNVRSEFREHYSLHPLTRADDEHVPTPNLAEQMKRIFHGIGCGDWRLFISRDISSLHEQRRSVRASRNCVIVKTLPLRSTVIFLRSTTVQ